MANPLMDPIRLSSLIRKYDVPGPRYTSYPTVPYWSRVPTEAEWLGALRDALARAQAHSEAASVYVHLPFCESLCTYCGCTTRITKNHGLALPYVDTVLQEWALYRAALDQEIPVGELHLGGGTPTFLSPDELDRLVTGILGTAAPAPEGRPMLSVEADPRVTTPAHLDRLARLGFTRLSLGVQDFDPEVQLAIHRVQSEAQVRAVVEGARRLGFTSVNMDLVYGLPFQTADSVEGTVLAITRLRPDRIAFYGYAHVPWVKPGQRRYSDADVPAGPEKRALYELGRVRFLEEGYVEIGMDHFALPDDPLAVAQRNGTLHRSFMGYVERHCSPMFGLGMSAIGDAWTAFAQNEKDLERYAARVQSGALPFFRGHLLDTEDEVLRRHVLELMTTHKTTWASPPETAYLASVPDRLREMAEDGLVELSPGSVAVRDAGRPFLRNACLAFDARLQRSAPETQIFSRTM